MSNFQVPYSSSLPSTPDTRRRHQTGDLTGGLTSNPSTTPAGPPNPHYGSFTPAGPPPSTPFGSSQIRTRGADTTTHSAIPLSADHNPFVRRLDSSFDPWARTKNGTPAGPKPRPQEESADNSQVESEVDAGDEDDGDGTMPISETGEGLEEDLFKFSSNSNILPPADDTEPVSIGDAGSSTQSVLRGTKRSHAGGMIDQDQNLASLFGAGQRRANPSPIPAIARDLAEKSRPAVLSESDDMILGTEELLDRMDHWRTPPDGQVFDGSMPFITEKISELWRSISDSDNSGSRASNDGSAQIGPNATASPIEKATFLTDLLLSIHHPPQLRTSNAFPHTRVNRAPAFSDSFTSQAAGKPYPIPRILLDWLAKHHDPYSNALRDLSAHQPNPTYHIYFWEITISSVLRGKLDDVIRILKQADFRHPQVALDDNLDQSQVPEVRLGSIRMVINRAIQILELCPAYTEDNWDMNGNDWSFFRMKVSQASRDLRALSGDENEPAAASFSAENFGIRNNQPEANSLTEASRQAQSKVPWPIYQSLTALYRILGGSTTAILANAQDWVEASLGLTIWWNGGKEPELGDSPKSYDMTISFSQSSGRQSTEPGSLYLERLAWSFKHATDSSLPDTFQVNTLSKVEVGLASVLEGNIEGVIGLLRGWSMLITATVLYIAKRGNWLEPPSTENLLTDFDKSDLMVLSYNQPNADKWKDEVLIEYTEALFSRDRLCGQILDRGAPFGPGDKRRVEREGWEIGIQVVSRLDDIDVASRKVGELLNRLTLDSSGRVDKLLRVCRSIGLSDQAFRIAEKYADALAENSYNYGETLMYYAQARHHRKLKSVLDLLVSFCLVQSTAYPPESELDEQLKRLISSPQQVLTELSRIDHEAAHMLQLRLSGYATVRRFYDLRDEEVNQKPGQKPKLREQARKRQALSTLLTIIESAADDIHGGLYDGTRNSIISVDCLLVLLGEALVFVDRKYLQCNQRSQRVSEELYLASKRVLDLPQTFRLLKAIEDLQTVTSRVYTQCEDLFQAAVSSAREPRGRPARDVLHKSISSLTASTDGFSMIGSSVLGPHSEVVEKADVKRGWDWRTGLPEVVEGNEVLGILRLGLAKELARGWLSGGGG
ncbi:MAG: hypothetical protein M1816_003535 [Peltula sp. TS41687]|nr:MAG: hypothetical protein M1816_003535 [Peltula sp. TS41687]